MEHTSYRHPSHPSHPYSPTHPNQQRPHYADHPSNVQHYSQHPHVPPSPGRSSSGHNLPPLIPASHHTSPRQYHQPLISSPTYHQTGRPYSSHHPALSNPYDGSVAGHAHPPSRQNSTMPSPIQTHTPQHELPRRDPARSETRPESKGKADRTSNPMSFASILASNDQPSPPRPSPQSPPRTTVMQAPSPSDHRPKTEHRPSRSQRTSISKTNGVPVAPQIHRLAEYPEKPRAIDAKPRYKMTMAEKEKFYQALAGIEANDVHESDLGWSQEKKEYFAKRHKRQREFEIVQNSRKRQRRTCLLDELSLPLKAHAAQDEARFNKRYAPVALQDIEARDVAAEKEKKKEAQRKRRRDIQMRRDGEELAKLQMEQLEAGDADQVLKLDQKIKKQKDKIQHTTDLLEGTTTLTVEPEDSIMDDVDEQAILDDDVDPLPKKKKATDGTMLGQSNRLKKSKEQKAREKAMAEEAYHSGFYETLAATPQPVLPSREESHEFIVESKASFAERNQDATPVQGPVNYDSKHYNEMIKTIIRDMAKKDVPKVHRLQQQMLAIRKENMRKTAILASKQARKWQDRTNKSLKDTQARGKRVMREMMSFWKRNEREERDMRRMAERKEIEDAKKAEADREANRQKRKLNFLISQTELYSHFIGKRIKTDEIERATDDPEVAATTRKITDGDKNAHTIDLPPSVADLQSGQKVTNFEDLDFDAEDETELRRAAAANAQSALDEAQARAREFDNNGDTDMDNPQGMNFMNPTMAGDVQVAQPKMLQATLKEYQLKGLNWLVNLYEQGINGILADEMGLGKTVQSISVMAYLAEQHNVWGPFLVICPASTLHNWHQEITKFVPNLKVLPYWGPAESRKVLRKFWDRKHISYSKDSEFHVLVTSYQLVVADAQYFQKIKWQYMILDEAQAIKSSQSSRWKSLLGLNCRNRLLLTGTPIQNNMQELWALLHFIMPTLFDSHDEFSEWFSKDIESHAQSNTKLNHDQLRRLHMILKPFMLRRVKAHVQKELGDKIEEDVFCDLTYRQRAYYANLRSKISIMDLIEKATVGDDQDAATLMNLVMQFRKVCNHPDLFERADTSSPFSMSTFAETASFLREGNFVQVAYSVKNAIEYDLPRILCNDIGRLDIAGPNNPQAGFRKKYLHNDFNIFSPSNISKSCREDSTFPWLRFVDMSAGELSTTANSSLFKRVLDLKQRPKRMQMFPGDDEPSFTIPTHSMLRIADNLPKFLDTLDNNSPLGQLCNISRNALTMSGYSTLEPASTTKALAPPIEIAALDQPSITERINTFFNASIRNTLFPASGQLEQDLLNRNISPTSFPPVAMYPPPENPKMRFTKIINPSMHRFVTDSGKLATLDRLLRKLKAGGHRVLLYFQMTRMMDLAEEFMTYRNYKYVRLDGSTKLEDRRDTVHDFQTRPEIFVFLLSTRAGGLGINLTSADTVIFYDSDWNPTIDSQAMDRAHRLGQTRQVTVYRLITRGTIEERIRKRAMQKEEVQRVVITGGEGAAGHIDFSGRNPRGENRTKDIAMWLADDEQAAMIERKDREREEQEAEAEKTGKVKKMNKKDTAKAAAAARRAAKVNMDDMYHEGEGNFDDQSKIASGAHTPLADDHDFDAPGAATGGAGGQADLKKRGPKPKSGKSKKAKTAEQRLAIIDGSGDMGMGGGN